MPIWDALKMKMQLCLIRLYREIFLLFYYNLNLNFISFTVVPLRRRAIQTAIVISSNIHQYAALIKRYTFHLVTLAVNLVTKIMAQK